MDSSRNKKNPRAKLTEEDIYIYDENYQRELLKDKPWNDE